MVKKQNMNYSYIILLLVIGCNNIYLNGQNTIQEINYKPIGIFHTNYTTKTGAPRQGILMPEGKGTIEIYPEYHKALTSLDLFEYIIVLYHFDKVNSWESIINPPSASHEHNFGLFSTRSPKRPNPIGFSILKLEKIKNGILYVTGVDAFDETPVLDIKPYLPSVDCVKSIQNELIEKILGHHDEIFIYDSTFYK
jgi:tRNA-Thr(GGU) m(6)t(6)A37 methyltransferase TsaA